MKRRDGRILAIQFLYKRDIQPDVDLNTALTDFWVLTEKSEPLRKFAESLIRGVLERRQVLDEMIQRYVQNWDLERTGIVDRNILRLALYEMHFNEDIPPISAINEAIEIAKTMGTQETSRFVNGILDRAKQDLKRSLR